jgi:hypothetical protein
VNSMLVCGACGRRCGVAHRGDHNRVVVEFRKRGEEMSGQFDVNDAAWDATSAMWSLTLFTCERCGAVLRLTPDRARAVGHQRHITLPVSTPR